MILAAAISRFLIVSVLAGAAPSLLMAQFMTRLAPETQQAFDSYVKTAEAGMDWKARLQPAAGTIAVAPGGHSEIVDIKLGIIHDWVAAALVRGATVEKVLAVLQNYESYQKVYAPDVTESRALGRDGNRWRVFLQLRKKKVLTVLLNSEYTVDYQALPGGRWSVLSHSTKIAEVDGERELPAGSGHGFLWRVNAYWLLEPRPDGVYLEARAISLSRDVPPGLAWAIKPMITKVPRESLHDTLAATVRALR